jgi:hypothetical protein
MNRPKVEGGLQVKLRAVAGGTTMHSGAALWNISEAFSQSRWQQLRCTSLTSTLQHAFNCLVCWAQLNSICAPQQLAA